MPANRPPAVERKAYIEIDLKHLRETGEVVTIGDPFLAPTITSKVPRGKFEITYTGELFGILQKLGNKKIEVFSYILANKDGNNCVNATNTQLAEQTGISRKTVVETMKILSDSGLIERNNSVIMISPQLMVKGNQQREAYLMRKFIETSQKTIDAEYDSIDAVVDEQYSFTADMQIVQKARSK